MDSDMFWKSPSSCRVSKVIWVVKQLLLFVGIITTALLMLKPSSKISYTFNLLCFSIPSFWLSLKSWFSPPYVYVIIYSVLILIIILASSSSSSSTFSFVHHNRYHHDFKDINISMDTTVFKDKGLQSHFVDKFIVGSSPEVWSVADSGDEFPQETSMMMPESGRKCTAGETKDRLEESVLKAIVCRWEDDDQYKTLDAKWKDIKEDRKQLTKHRKSQTWDVPHENIFNLAPREMRKLDTFVGERSSVRAIGGLRREELLGHDELNRQVEAFIKKCKKDMPFKI
ncbi:uncharacterized protein LOC132252790 [Vitis vinifera]|uniref:uncharacterized protein LOC132252790 n=1 Tax=Vitis vinifera TaxID=29760 RepID=UPI001FC5968E|nr:uncharacterized protein LOC132252790 [Vitis vinifera]